MDNRIINVKFAEGERVTLTSPVYQYNYGQILAIEGLDLPSTFEVQFAHEGDAESTTSIGQDNQVVIPDMYFESGKGIYAWIYLHDTSEDGETVYQILIPVRERSQPSDIEPIPVQQDVITQAIAALNEAVDDCEEAVSHYPKIDSETGNWNVWDGEEETWSDTGVHAQGMQGEPGTPGADGKDGKDGADGQDGFSPVVSVSEITGGHEVSITDASGTETFDVMDGDPTTIIDDSSTSASKVWSSYKVSNTETSIKNIIAPEYGSLTPHAYVVGDVVTYNNKMYNCISNTEGEWDSQAWHIIPTLPESGINIPAGDYVAYNGYAYLNISGYAMYAMPSYIDNLQGIFEKILPTTYISFDYLTFNIGDFCIHEDKMYKCLEQDSGENWDSTKWNEISVTDDIKSIDSEISTIQTNLDLKANKQDARFTGSFTHAGRMPLSTVGERSCAFNYGCEASGEGSFAIGKSTQARSPYTFTAGQGTQAIGQYQFVFGKYNDTDNSKVEIVGNGTAMTRSNARTLDWNGNEWLAGKLTIAGTPTGNNDVVRMIDIAGKQDTLTAGDRISIANNVISASLPWKDVTGTLTAGSTSITLSDSLITTDSTIDVYTDTFGVNPSNVSVATGSVTLTFDALASDMGVKVRVS